LKEETSSTTNKIMKSYQKDTVRSGENVINNRKNIGNTAHNRYKK
jgi:hypothetical protein